MKRVALKARDLDPRPFLGLRGTEAGNAQHYENGNHNLRGVSGNEIGTGTYLSDRLHT